MMHKQPYHLWTSESFLFFPKVCTLLTFDAADRVYCIHGPRAAICTEVGCYVTLLFKALVNSVHFDIYLRLALATIFLYIFFQDERDCYALGFSFFPGRQFKMLYIFFGLSSLLDPLSFRSLPCWFLYSTPFLYTLLSHLFPRQHWRGELGMP